MSTLILGLELHRLKELERERRDMSSTDKIMVKNVT